MSIYLTVHFVKSPKIRQVVIVATINTKPNYLYGCRFNGSPSNIQDTKIMLMPVA